MESRVDEEHNSESRRQEAITDLVGVCQVFYQREGHLDVTCGPGYLADLKEDRSAGSGRHANHLLEHDLV